MRATNAKEKPWKDNRPLSLDEARQLIELQFTQLNPVSIAPLGSGWDNDAFLVNDEFAFRFPRREIGASCMAAELRVLPALANRLPYPISAPILVGRPAGDYPWPFAGANFLAGTNLCDAIPDASKRAGLARPLGQFLRKLHEIGKEAGIQALAEYDTIRRLDIGYRVAVCRERLAQLSELRLIETAEPCLGFLAEVEKRRPQPTVVSLVHGDLYSRHVLVDEAGQLAGVIDWGDVHIGSVAVDLAIAFLALPRGSHDVFFEEYGPIDDQTLLLCRFRTVIHALCTALYSHDIGDERFLQESLRALRDVLDGSLR